MHALVERAAVVSPGFGGRSKVESRFVQPPSGSWPPPANPGGEVDFRRRGIFPFSREHVSWRVDYRSRATSSDNRRRPPPACANILRFLNRWLRRR